MKTVFIVIGVFVLIVALANSAVQQPVRVGNTIQATVTNNTTEVQVAELWQSVFKIGPDGKRNRVSVLLNPGASHTFKLNCYVTTATYQWWTELGDEVSSKLSVKCR